MNSLIPICMLSIFLSETLLTSNTHFSANKIQHYKHHIQTQNDSSQPLWPPKKISPKNDHETIFFFLISRLRINSMHFKPELSVIVLSPRPPAKTNVSKFLLDSTLTTHVLFFLSRTSYIWNLFLQPTLQMHLSILPLANHRYQLYVWKLFQQPHLIDLSVSTFNKHTVKFWCDNWLTIWWCSHLTPTTVRGTFNLVVSSPPFTLNCIENCHIIHCSNVSQLDTHGSQRGTKFHLKKHSHLNSQFPPEMTSLKSQQNFQTCLKSNFLFTPISNIYFKRFSRWLESN